MSEDEATVSKPRRWRFQFGLATFLLVTLLLGPILAWLAIQLRLFDDGQVVSGRIIQSGKPVQNVAVSFMAPDNSFTAKTITDAAGNFAFNVPAGEYLVSLDETAPATINPKYRTPFTSGLMVSIRPGANVIEFNLP